MGQEAVFWIVVGVAGLVAAIVLWAKAKRISEEYAQWIEEL